MTPKLLIEAIIKYIFGILLAGILIFLPAGTFRFPNGWLLMGVLFVPIFIAGIVMTIKSPALLEKRINGKEKQKDQRIVVKLSGLMFLLGFIAAGLQFRFGILPLPAGNLLCRGGGASFCLSALCRSDAGKRLSLPHH